MKSKELIKLAVQWGFSYKRNGKGGHVIYKNPKHTLSIPVHNKDLQNNLCAGIIKQIKTHGEDPEKENLCQSSN